MLGYTCSLSPTTALLQFVFLAVYSCIILKIPPKWKALRLLSVLPLASITHTTQQSLLHTCHNPHWRGLGAPLLWIQYLSAVDLIAASCAAGSHFRPPKHERRPHLYRIVGTVGLLWNLRRLGTMWGAATACKIRTGWQETTTTTSRGSFLVRRIPLLFIAYLALELFVSIPGPPDVLVQPWKQTLWQRLGELSIDDVAFRVIGTVSFWAVVALLLFVIHTTVVVLGVVLSWWEPSSCAPLFGHVREAYTIRKFWGSLWHQCLRPSLTAIADLVCDSILRIPRGTLLSRYSRLALVFAISGAVHYASDVAMGVAPGEAGGHLLFMLQVPAIMVEDLVQFLAERVLGKRRSRSLQWASRVIGHVWVLGVLAWSTPTWFYPTRRLGSDPAALLPFRVLSGV